MLHAADCAHLIVDRYDDRSALALARHAVAAYDDGDGYARLCLGGDWECARGVETGATQVGLASSPEAIVVAVRGSEEGVDWWEDLRSAFRRPASRAYGRSDIPGSIGRGFAAQARRVWPDLAWWIEHEMRHHPRAPVYWTGHSLGAAVAPLLMEQARLDFGRRAAHGGYLFETPRLGNMEFVTYWDSRHPHVQSVAHAWRGVVDIVTRLPPRWTGARHVCRERLTVIRGGVTAGTTEGYAGWRLVSRLGASVRAHGMARIVTTLEGRVAA